MALVIFLVGRSFGFFQYTKKGDVINYISINGLNISIDSTTDNALNITDAYPQYDSDGLQNDPFTFTITNTSKKAIDYTLKLLNDSEKQELCYVDEEETIPCTLLPYQYIKYAYSINNGSYSTPANLTSTGEIYTETITSSASTTISIKLWIDSTAPNSIQGNAFFGKLILSGDKHIPQYVPTYYTIENYTYLDSDGTGNYTVLSNGTINLRNTSNEILQTRNITNDGYVIFNQVPDNVEYNLDIDGQSYVLKNITLPNDNNATTLYRNGKMFIPTTFTAANSYIVTFMYFGPAE